nr:immunoglobulin heavy chain junction region [Macaca mulatta]MOV37862.1 immunoglobulin heavy chain junction region [Macaca mulatta]MOV38567.1 immunoglobulin heavy chain junction region [Macaca mulatta]MOV38967.1 immunoglobulin heavy chain junction region [Macaca mulatta]MOV39027.1 immunoglobulin heavy chain junction region [Macaca mulatta]
CARDDGGSVFDYW